MRFGRGAARLVVRLGAVTDLQPDTRLAMIANPATGRMLLQAWEGTGRVTAVLELG